MQIKKSYDCFLENDKGETFVDFMLGSGTHLLGHGFFNEYVEQVLDDGLFFGVDSVNGCRLRESLQNIFCNEDEVIFCNTGSEANMKAIRACRAFTGKNKVAMFSGSWHGSYDSLLFQENWSVPRWPPTWRELDYKFHVPIPVSSVSEGVIDHDEVDVYPYNMDFSLHYLNTKINQYSSVIIEPIQGSNPREDMKWFLDKLREITKRAGVPLIFDEVITGFRVGLTGVQGWYGVQPDISVFGKIIGGGTPFGVVMGNVDILNTSGVYYGGTFSGNSFGCGMGNVVLKYLQTHTEIYTELYNLTESIVNEIESYTQDFPISIMKCHSFFRIIFSEHEVKERRDREDFEDYSLFLEFKERLEGKGVLVGNNGLFFVCPSHAKYKDRYVGQIVESIKEIFSE